MNGSLLPAPGSRLVLVIALVACSGLKTASNADDAGSGVDGSSPSDTPDATTVAEAGVDASVPSGDDAGDAETPKGPTGLDPELPVPPLDAGPPCDQPGNETRCTGLSACRFALPDSGICEPCPVGACGQLIGKTCAKSNDCDIDLECYKGSCTLVCRFPYQGECGGARKCIDVGYLGAQGVCDANPPY